MSADNYYFVRKLPNGKYDVTHRFASNYYRDEVGNEPIKQSYWLEGNSKGWKIRGMKDNTIYATQEEAEAKIPLVPNSWIEEMPPQLTQFDKLEDAVVFAHTLAAKDIVVEYGVVIQEGLI